MIYDLRIVKIVKWASRHHRLSGCYVMLRFAA